MRFYSDITNKLYNSKEEALAAEAKVKEQQAAEVKKTEERGKRAKDVEAAYKAYIDAYKSYVEKLNQFIKDYGSFHMTYSDSLPVESDAFESLFEKTREILNKLGF